MASRPTRSGVIQLQEHEGFGGNFFDTRHLSSYFNYDMPHDFGRMVSKIFTSSTRFTTKVLTGLTYARGNYHVIDGDTYRWTLTGDDERLIRITEFVETNPRPGFANSQLRFVADKGWCRQPDVLMAEDNRFLIRIIGDPIQKSEDRWEYTAVMQKSDPTFYIPASQLQVGMTMKKVSTSVATEDNQIFGGTQWGAQIELQSQIGAYAEEFGATDKVVRKEIAARKNGNVTRTATKSMGQYTGYGALSGFYAPFNISKNGKHVPAGAFFTHMEADLLERIEMGREMMMVFGGTSTTMDNTGKYIQRTGPGFRELVMDGHEWYHNGSMTAQQLEDFFMQIFLYRKNEGERKVVIDTGTLGSRFFDQLLADEARSFLVVDTLINRRMEGGEDWELEYGAQYKSFRAKNGIRVRLFMNPMKDDPNICRRMHPDNPIYTVDSARMDIYDFGGNTESVAPDNANISMIMENGVDEYYWISPLIDPYTGVVTDGSRVASGEKGVKARRMASGSLCVWDTSRIGSIIYEPELV
jgi:hypothetical protein